MTLSTIFITIFIVTLVILFANLLLGGVFDLALGFDSEIFNLTTTLCFLGVASVIGYILVNHTSFSTNLILTLAAFISLALTVILNIFVFIPLSKMESSTAFRLEDLQGEVGEVTLAILPDSVGELAVSTGLGTVTRTARSYDGSLIEQGEQALIIEVKEHIFYVVKYDENFDSTKIKKSGGF